MDEKRPKRRKDKYNPYTIYKVNGVPYVSFRDGQGIQHILELTPALFETFDQFELEDLSHLNKVDRHQEFFDGPEEVFLKRAAVPQELLEDIVARKFRNEALYAAIDRLPETQRRRLKLRYFDGLTYREIAEREGCTIMPVKRSIEVALEQLKNILLEGG